LTGSGRILLSDRQELLAERTPRVVEVSSEEIQNQILGSQQIECTGIH
jgi:hypothetical protein